MSLNLEGKKEVVAEVSARLADAQAIVLAEYRGLPVEKITQLRARARASGVYLRVLKNTLARRAVQGTPFEKLAGQMVGPATTTWWSLAREALVRAICSNRSRRMPT